MNYQFLVHSGQWSIEVPHAKSQATKLCWINIQVLTKAEFSSQIHEAQILVSTVPKVPMPLVQSVVPLIITLRLNSAAHIPVPGVIAGTLRHSIWPPGILLKMPSVHPLYILQHMFNPVQVSQITSSIWNVTVYHTHRGCSAEFLSCSRRID